jgi:hypothetical protein
VRCAVRADPIYKIQSVCRIFNQVVPLKPELQPRLAIR